MQLIADRFVVDERGQPVDLATGERVCLVMSTAGGTTEQSQWAERCAWFSMVVHPSLPPLLDYGALGTTKRFEAWAAQPGWKGAGRAADDARACAARFLVANGRAPVSMTDAALGSRAGRPVAVPDAAAGRQQVSGGARLPDAGADLLGIIRTPDRRLQPVLELFSGQTSSRVTAVAVWAPEAGGASVAVQTLARTARLAGFVPVSTRMFDAPIRALWRGRTLVIFAEDVDSGWCDLLDGSLDTARPHIVVFAGAHAPRRVHTVSLERLHTDALVASVCPPAAARAHGRQVRTAARRAQGLRERFEQLLLGTGAGRRLATAHLLRASEATATDESGLTEAENRGVSGRATWPAPGEMLRLRRHLEAALTLLAKGRHRPGEREARQVMHGFVRRSEWADATRAAIALARSLLQRGRVADAASVVDEARPWARASRDLQHLQQLGTLAALVRIDEGRLADAEVVLDGVIASAVGAGGDVLLDAVLALVRSLYWQGRYADAWQKLAFLQPAPDDAREAAVRWLVARSRVWIGRGRAADAVADAARARDGAAAIGNTALCGVALYACAQAQLAVGDAAQADTAAGAALLAARQSHQPLLALRVRVLRAEIARRNGQRGPATLLVRRLGRAGATTLPASIRARIDLLRASLSAANPAEAAERLADITGLAALRLCVPQRPAESADLAPAADDIVELLRCCQSAEEDQAVLTSVCAHLRGRLSASTVAFFGLVGAELVWVAGAGPRIDALAARRVHTANQLVSAHHGSDRPEAGVPVRYAGEVAGVLVAVWTPAAVWHGGNVSILLSTGATAASPALAGLMTRRATEPAARTAEIIGVGSGIAAVRAAIEKAAHAPFAVLVEGESGSGKELVARLLHRLGTRRDRPFCTLNCAALPEDLVESELFGHARGAFTGAASERRGVFEEAHTGTLFLDEVGELSARAQAKLLRAIQEGEVRRVGENVCRRVDVRLITATNRDLRAEVAAGRFRLDLLYRLDVVRIPLPPLRERRDDIPVLADHFWRDATGRVGSRATLSATTLAALARYDWPGNIRELQNVLASLAVRCPKRGVVAPSALPPQFGQPDLAASFQLESARRTFDRAFIRAALVRAGGHRSRAAEELGVSRQGLAKLMSRLDIDGDERVDAH